ncbi:Ig-like domain-containing protein, partial [Acinetobacter oleivorans]|uniref:Ig-like domain-containing protein n=9 Tax=Acinetobacter oleivorans TaxID=1148157 RepID=UPI00208DFCAF
AEPGSTVTVTFPDGTTATVVAGTDGSWTVPNPGLEDGDEVKATATDPAGNTSPPATEIVDAIAPAAPEIDPINGTDPITGTAEPGSTVTVTFPDGTTATVVAGTDGSWTVPNPGLEDGDEVKATATDPAGNTSPPATEIVDAIAPAAPEIDPINGTDPITGTAEPGSTVTVTFPDGTTATVVAGTDGSWTVPNPGLNDGDEVKATATDPAGNISPPATEIVDAIAPAVPEIDPINGTDPITGTAEPGSTVTVTFPDGTTATVVAGTDGSWTVPNPGLNDGDEVKATATDPAGNISPPATEIVDAIAPAVPEIDPINGTDPITGTAEPGSTVTVTFPDGTTATVVAGTDGSWTVPNPGLNDGDEVKATATDPAGNTSPPTTEIVDAIAPAAPEIDPINGTDPITGTAEPGSTVTVTFPDGTTATVVAGTDGSWTVPNPGLEDGDEVKATATDPAGNTSPPATEIVDAIAPAVPEIDPINGTDPITGTAEPGSTVTV